MSPRSNQEATAPDDVLPPSPWHGRARLFGRVLVAIGTILLMFGLPTFLWSLLQGVLYIRYITFASLFNVMRDPALFLVGQGLSAFIVGGWLIEFSFRRKRRR